MLGIITPKILLPKKKYDYKKWAVIAVDQFTSDKEYWASLDRQIEDSPSALRLVLPEIYLTGDYTQRLQDIQKNMQAYIDNDVFDEYEGFILTERKTAYGNRRLGLLVAIDLETYNLDQTQKTSLRATEQTVISRLPVRAEIRKNALIELPHTLVLFEDERKELIEQLYKNKQQYKQLYDFELNMNGGSVSAYYIEDTQPIIDKLQQLTKDKPFAFGVGDGNHSLAAASLYWNELKTKLSTEERQNHPARYALVELNNLFADELKFEPIHRVVFNFKDDFFDGLKNCSRGNKKISYYYQGKEYTFTANDNAIMAIGEIEKYVVDYVAREKAGVDYVHGKEYSIEAANMYGGVAIFMPSIEKATLFATVEKLGVLPRKTFSMGEAEEKRYYIEARKIR